MMREGKNRGKLIKVALLAALGISVLLAVSGASAAPLTTGTPGVSIIAQNGLGTKNNTMAWSMAWFRGKLYLGAGRDELCVENETTQFYYPDTDTYTTNPSPDVHCPSNPYNMSLRAQLWQYTPPANNSPYSSGKWKLVYQPPMESNPYADKSVSRDLAYRGMVTWTNPQGHQALFAAAVTPDEFLPPLLKSHPPVLMRSYDGVHWQTLHLPSVVVDFPNGDARPMGFRSMVIWHNHLFVTATPDITGDGALFEVTNPWSNHPGLRQVSGPQYDIFEVETFDGGLYIGTGNKEVGYGVYRAFDDSSKGYFNFHQVVANGAGRGYLVTSVVSMHVYRNRLYIGASGWYNQGTLPVSELIRVAPNGQWDVVVGDPRNVNGVTKYPVSGMYDGFYSPFAAHFWRMEDQGGGLYLGTNDWAYALQADKQYAWLQETVLADVLGFNLWATCDGNDWFAVTRDAFTDNEYNFGGRTLIAGGPHDSDLFIGTTNEAQGLSVFDDQGDACGSLVNAQRQDLARPAALMTESVKGGTLLSWERTPHATSYVVEQAPFVSVTLGLTAPPTIQGWQYEDAAPGVTQPGAPGSVTSTLQVPGAFTAVATTDNPDYVAHTTGHYIYEVVAKTSSGAASSPSNVEVAPFGGAPTTFSSLQSTLSTPSTGAKGAVASAAESRQQRLLAEAENAVARGEDSLARRYIAELKASAGYNDALAASAARVERRLQYANIAGAP